MKREVENKVLLLKLISLAQKINLAKLSHIVFILQQEGRREQKQTFNYEFVKWNIEAYCPELERDVEHLLFEKLLQNEQGVSVTPKGKALLQQQNQYFKANNIQSFFHFYLYIYTDFPLYQLTDTVCKQYELGRFQDKEIVAEISDHTPVRPKAQLEETRRKIQAAYDELEKKDEVYMKKIQQVMQQLKESDVEKKNAE